MDLFEKNKFLIKVRKIFEKNHSVKLALMKIIDKFLSIRMKIEKYQDDFNFDRIIWISPKRLKYYQPFNYKVFTHKKIHSGDWDLPENMKLFTDSVKYQSCYEHFILKKDWSETEYYKQISYALAKGGVKYRCYFKEDQIKRFKFLDSLYENIEKKGYKTQEELRKNKVLFMDAGGYTRISRRDHEILIGIGRNGEPIFIDGRHRLIIAKLLDIKKVPVKISLIHQDYLKNSI